VVRDGARGRGALFKAVAHSSRQVKSSQGAHLYHKRQVVGAVREGARGESV
jgi:hypothetical protein